MKNLIKYVILAICLSTNLATNAGKKGKVVKTELKVYGVCGDCKERIQEAVFAVKGVKTAEWNKKTKMLKVAYSADKCNTQTIEAAVAAIGHDTDNVKANDTVYNKLPGCCAYRSGVACKH